MTFRIYLDGVRGGIVAGALNEEFEVDASEWSENDYKLSWRGQLQKLLDGVDRAVLFTAAHSSRNANWLRGYVLYRIDGEVHIQERIFFAAELPRDFDLDNPGAFLEDRKLINEDGLRVSEWIVPLSEIQAFCVNY